MNADHRYIQEEKETELKQVKKGTARAKGEVSRLEGELETLSKKVQGI